MMIVVEQKQPLNSFKLRRRNLKTAFEFLLNFQYIECIIILRIFFFFRYFKSVLKTFINITIR